MRPACHTVCRVPARDRCSPALAAYRPALPLPRLAGRALVPELVCFAFLAYPCACATYSLYRLGRFHFFRMVPRHTDAYSLCYSALLMCRFAAPLAFNWMAAIALPEREGHPSPVRHLPVGGREDVLLVGSAIGCQRQGEAIL